jgi:hypothetical protein
LTSENGSETTKSQVLSTVEVISANNSRSETTNGKKTKTSVFFSRLSHFNINQQSFGEKKKTINDDEEVILRADPVGIMSSSSTAMEILNFVSQYSFYSGCFIFAFGIIGNAINILVFTQLKLFRDNRSAFYLTVESISSCLYLFIIFILTIFTLIYGDDGTGRFLVWCRVRYILGQTGVLIVFSMTCCAAADQFFSTNYRLNLREFFTLKVARWFTFTFVCVWTIHSIIFGLFSGIQPSVGCVISNQIYVEYAIFFLYPVLFGLLPIVIASFFSLLAFQNVRRIVRRQLPIVRRRLDRQMTAMVLIRVVFFVCFAFPYCIFRIYAINYPISRSQPMEFATRQLLQAIFLSFTNLNYTVQCSFIKLTSVMFRFVVGEFLCLYDLIITFSSSSETCFGEKMLATMETFVLFNE